jgi:hypothetical protein
MSTRLLICFTAAFLLNAASAAEEQINYADHVRPIFRDKCFSCHNTNKKSASLDLTSYTAIMQGGASGEVISVGSAEESYLFMLITHESEPAMPPESDRLPDPMLDTVRKWINGGAPETSSSKVMLPKKPKIDLNVTVSAGARPEGPPPVPDVLNLEPFIQVDGETAVSAIATSPWAPVVAVAGQKQVVLYDSRTLKATGVLPFPEGQIRVLKFSRNGSLLLAGGGRGGSKGLAVVWNVRTGERVFEVGDELDEVMAADISADHEFVALGGPQKIVRVYETLTGKLVWEATKHTDWVTSLEFSPDAVLLASSDRAGGLHVWEAFTGRHYAPLLGHKEQVNSVSWRIDSNVLASASKDASIKLWEMEGGNNIKSWNAHGGGTASVEFCRDGRLVSCGRDKVTKLWDQNGKELLAFEAFPDLALRVSHCDETDRVVAGGWTGMIRAWSATDGKRVGELSSNPPTLESRLAAVNSALPAALEAQAQAKATLASVAAQHKTEADKLAASQAILTTAQQTIATLQQDKETQEPALAAVKATLDQQQKALAALQTALPNLKQASESAAVAAAALPSDKPLAEAAEKMAQTLQERTVSAAALQQQLGATTLDASQRETAFNNLLAKLTQTQQTASTADAAIKAAMAALEPLKPQLAELQQVATSADAKVSALQHEVEHWKQYIALRDELKALETQRDSKEALQLAKLEAENALTEHQAKIDASKQSIATHQQTVAAHQKTSADLQNRVTATKQQEEQQQAVVTQHTKVIPVLESALTQAQAALALLPNDDAIQATVTSINAAIAAKKDSMAAAQQAIAKSQDSIKADDAALVVAADAIRIAQAKAAAEQQILATLQAEREPLTGSVATATANFQAADTKFQEALQVVESRRAQIRPATEVTQAAASQ